MIVAVVVALSVALDAYVLWRLRAYAVLPQWVAVAYGALAAVINLWFVAFLVAHRGTSMFEMANALYYFSTFLLPKLLFLLISVWGQIPPISHTMARPVVDCAATLIALFLFAAMWWGTLVNINKLRINEVTIESPRLPKQFDGYRIAQISDLHVGSRGSDTSFAEKLASEINAQKPDLILFTGDIVNHTAEEATPFAHALSALSAPDGVHSVLGNHDYGMYMPWRTRQERDSNLQRLKDFERNVGWDLMLNEHRVITRDSASIALIGVENWGLPPFPQFGSLKKAYPDLCDNRFKILMSHDPSHWRAQVTGQTTIDLMLAGHTHAMQSMISIFGRNYSLSALKYKEWAGLYAENDQYLYVNIGAGFIGFKTRIGSALPEITIITLKHKE